MIKEHKACDHQIHDLAPTLKGILCRECRMEWTAPGLGTLWTIIKREITGLCERVENIEMGLLHRLKLARCSKCGDFFPEHSWEGLWISDRFAHLCIHCLFENYHRIESLEDDELLPIERRLQEWHSAVEKELTLAETENTNHRYVRAFHFIRQLMFRLENKAAQGYEKPEDAHLEMEYEARTDPDSQL